MNIYKNVERKNVLAAFAYLIGPLTGLLLLCLVRKNSFIRYHAMQSTLLFGFLTIVYMILVTTYIGVYLIGFILIAHFVVLIVLMWKAFNGKKVAFPIIGRLTRHEINRIG